MLTTSGVVKLILIHHLLGASSTLATSNGSVPLSRRHTDNLLIARCRSKCTNTFDKKTMCESSCIRDYLGNPTYKKFGDCPKDPLNRLEAICLNTCQSTDYHCPGVEKCCSHSCGMSCQAPVGLDKVSGLPPVPSHVSLREAGRSFRMAEIQWDISLEEESSAVYFVVESRHHIGVSFAERKLEDDWQYHMPTVIYEVARPASQKRYIGEMKLKPGRWYQVRVAAVNELGTKGYSTVSKEFQLSKTGPNPPQPPKNLTLGPLTPNANGTYNRKISWMLPRSDLPVEKYKISWSLYLNATSGARMGNSSLFKETATISAPARHFEIKGLQPNSIYYLQIHAISVYGKRRMKSQACNELMVTSVDANESIKLPSMDNMLMNDASYHRRTKSGLSAQGLHYKFVPRKTGLAVRLTWSGKSTTGRFRLHLCRGTRDCLTKPMSANSHDVVVKQKTSYEFPRLEYDTKYTVGLRHSRRRPVAPIASPKNRIQRQAKTHTGAAEYDNVRTFVTPKCDRFQKEHPDHQIECSA
ncbi:anosmin-1 isoform X1 [Wyeomyia smithii]|uniref:anosmin-1 isoform X1 n=1 Tax=Wyeomyia smithii TaxID=174621 RepID=UPI002467EC71|nr:anosmin-1 isoform X1 [Wyeomyia smithii]XP_055523590.1 anosmin-1 isoform X1 [Wyeomyia smithii]